MNSPNLDGFSIKNPQYSRDTFIKIIKASIYKGEYKFTHEAVQKWLEYFPRDIEFNYMLALSLYEIGEFTESLDLVYEILSRDPEYLKPYELLLNFENFEYAVPKIEILACAKALSGDKNKYQNAATWSSKLLTASQAFDNGLHDVAEKLIQEVIGLDISTPLPAVLHLRIVAASKNLQTIQNLAQLYHVRWTSCLQFSLFYARSQIELQGDDKAVDLLQECVVNDPANQVANRIWGSNNPFRSLWPSVMEIDFPLQIPMSVSSQLGWNVLQMGEKHFDNVVEEVNFDKFAEELSNSEDKEWYYEKNIAQEIEPLQREKPGNINNNSVNINTNDDEKKPINKRSLPLEREPKQVEESLKPIDDTLIRLGKKLKKSTLASKDNRFPIYVIFSSKTGLDHQYGEQTTKIINKSLMYLTEVIKNKKGWGSMVFYPDDPEVTKVLGLDPIKTIDPWNMKLSLVDLEGMLAKKGAMIGSLLIVGGNEVVPFHKLPNPTDDVDEDVLSDNPYSTLDANYFVPEWPVGRVPGDIGSDAGLLLSQIRSIIKSHTDQKETTPWWANITLPYSWWHRIQEHLKKQNNKNNKSNFGYSAAVWRRSSLAAFRPIGQGHDLLVSPPEASGSFEEKLIINSSMGYYNLHGLIDSAEWYGQKDVFDPTIGPDYPIALKTSDLNNNGNFPKIIFSEACYGGYVEKKSEDDSIALKFLSIGTPTFVGSTGIAYGSVNTPLIGADLLGYLFFKGVTNGLNVGEALMGAKIEFVREMNKRQGFLDGEDQKTLLSFVLYGDPLRYFSEIRYQEKQFSRLKYHPYVRVISDNEFELENEKVLNPNLLSEVKSVVEEYLPGLGEAKVHIWSNQHMGEVSDNKNSEPMEKAFSDDKNDRVVVTFKKYVKMPADVRLHQLWEVCS